jgi:hypothetical protein
MAFWWNWDIHQKLDASAIAPAALQSMKDMFVPMLWGQDLEPDFAFMADHEGDVMGYNEPDRHMATAVPQDDIEVKHPVAPTLRTAPAEFLLHPL